MQAEARPLPLIHVPECSTSPCAHLITSNKNLLDTKFKYTSAKYTSTKNTNCPTSHSSCPPKPVIPMAPNHGLVHPKQYDIKDSNVELIGSDLDHSLKYKSALEEPAWNNGAIGTSSGLFIWRIESFEVVEWPSEKHGQFHTGDSYIVLHSFKVGDSEDNEKLVHDIFFWLGSETTQDEAGTAAYKTVELDEFLKGVATQHRELEQEPSEEFLALFPRLTILSGGVRSGFRHVEEEEAKDILTLLRIFKLASGERKSTTVVHEVEPSYKSLDSDDVFVLDTGSKIWVWQGKNCSPMEKAKAAQVFHDMTLAKHIDVEVLSESEPRSRRIVELLGCEDPDHAEFKAKRPVATYGAEKTGDESKKLFRLSDASGELAFEKVRDGKSVSTSDLDGSDVFLLDTGRAIWVWEGLQASKAEKAMWLKVAQAYVRNLGGDDAYLEPIAKVVQGNEPKSFMREVTA